MLNPTKFESSSSYCFAVYYLKQIQECLPNSTERVVAIGASSEDGVIDVIRRVLEIMQEQPIKGGISLYDPSLEPWEQGG